MPNLPFKIEPQNPTDIPTALRRKLRGLGIAITDIKPAISGPLVTAYPIVPDISTPIAKILSKSEDLALACGVDFVDVRRIGREIHVFVPNGERKVVQFLEAVYWFIAQEEAKESGIPLLLGMDSTGAKSWMDLTKQPHLLIAGSTGSGKSILEANIIASLAMMKSENELHMYLVDTKMLDLSLFSKLPHVKSIVREVEDFYYTITDLQGEVTTRSKTMAEAGVRNIQEYNLKNPGMKMPYILLMIDELADLIDKDKDLRAERGKQHDEPKVMDSIRKLIRISRAAGVHLVACTQRTSGDIVAAEAKTNFPARISLKLPSARDSEYILDEKGAENLLGSGDFLLKETDKDTIKRFHAPFVKLEDIKLVIEQMDLIKKSLFLEA